ncbi:glycine--tRNA ligase subunit beta [Fervidobacterium thailandense]|uniref:Glycine--tRNA ligase beta subunit n=1 Tax=Fervidobacterium thailandense TaxID=1008305 RepID=A0A1E3G2A7_9BACT|nr:glycine--tRNA ligase subunit beta [Fervidobacterium thailandense]ODN30260.1 glycine--tRNA ligase subunit beta [Fervidobacterium thailandense]
MNTKNEFLLEIGVEELPTTEVHGILAQLDELIDKYIVEEGLTFDEKVLILAPRRLGFYLRGLPERSADKVIEKKGPSVQIAYDVNGQPTKALLGFLKSAGASLEDVKVVENYVYVQKKLEGLTAKELLRTVIPKMIEALRFRKPMKWGSGKYEFVRIPHHVLAIFNGEVVEFELFGLKSSNKTVGHRFVKDEYFEVSSVDDYLNKMREFYVIPVMNQRIEFIKSQLLEFEKNGLTVDKDEELIEEVAILTEYPKLISGTFDTKFMELPEELIRTTIKHHQRAFTTHKDCKLTNTFVAFIDKPSDVKDNARKGYERVINARLEDARYYYEKDVKVPLETFNEKLKEIVFQKELGTLHDKVLRVEKLSEFIIEALGMHKLSDKILRTARLCKADIGSHVVYEFPELQGTMGRIYALKDGEPREVAFGIEEHYSSDPDTVTGAVVGIADRIDTIVGNFLIGNIPTGSKDPYGLRSKVDDIFKIIEKFEWQIDVEQLLKEACKLLGKELPQQLVEFFETRFELYNSNIRYDIARATKHLWKVPIRGILSAKAIASLVGTEDFEHLIVGFERVHNISKKHNSTHFDAAKFVQEEEKTLFEKYLDTKVKVFEALKHLNYKEALDKFIKLRPFIDAYFDKVFVMVDEEDIRLNRLGFLKNLDELFLQVGDLTLIEKHQK